MAWQLGEEEAVMKGGTQAAVALGVGYLLGRRRKLRMATLMAAGAATGGLGSLGGGLLLHGRTGVGRRPITRDGRRNLH